MPGYGTEIANSSPNITVSLSSSYGAFTSSINLFTASQIAINATINSFTASFSSSVRSIGDIRYVFTSSYDSFTGTQNTINNNLNAFSATINVFTQSINGFTASFSSSVQFIGDARYVQTINAFTGAVTLSAGPNITLSSSGNVISITGSRAQYGEIILAVSGGGVDNNSSRPQLLSGNYSQYPFATFQGALDRLANDTNRSLNYNVYIIGSTGTFDGYNVEGFVGRSDLYVVSSYKNTTVSAGVFSGTARRWNYYDYNK